MSHLKVCLSKRLQKPLSKEKFQLCHKLNTNFHPQQNKSQHDIHSTAIYATQSILEIWGRAQLEAAWHPKSVWKYNFVGCNM